MSLRKFVSLAVLSGLFVIPRIASAQKPSYGLTDRENQHRSMAVQIVKAINAAEADFKKNHGTYATWSTLVSTGYFTPSGTKWAPEEFPTVAHAMYGPGPEVVPGWKLRLSLSKDGAAYDVMLVCGVQRRPRARAAGPRGGMRIRGRASQNPSIIATAKRAAAQPACTMFTEVLEALLVGGGDFGEFARAGGEN